jgi:predicted nucleotidyltransferase
MSLKTHKRLSIEELRIIVKPVAEKYDIDKIYLFGSVARGDYKENSDYDFYIEADKIRSIFVISEFFQDLYEAIGHNIDMISSRSVRPELMNKIMAEGVLVYGQ